MKDNKFNKGKREMKFQNDKCWYSCNDCNSKWLGIYTVESILRGSDDVRVCPTCQCPPESGIAIHF